MANEALILQAIYHSEGEKTGASLRSIIAYADYVNHAILTFDELSTGLMKLESLGVVVSVEKFLKPVPNLKSGGRRNSEVNRGFTF